MMYHLRSSFFVLVFAFVLAFLFNRFTQKSTLSQPIASLPASYLHPSKTSLTRPVFSPSKKRTADTTAVLLNWSRFPNVVRIVSLLCDPLLEDTIAAIHVWNNSPNQVSKEDFSACSGDRIKIFNSPSNIYFQARFLSCAEADTPFCFIQDDDYLVLPEIIHALRSSFSESSRSGIYLLPPHEAFSSQLKRIRVGSNIHSAFAWLGHGSFIKRSQARDFLSLMAYLDASDEEMRMADNYYALLANVFPEVWFDQGIELGGGQPFTQGLEGDERNKRHIIRAAQFLDKLAGHDNDSWTSPDSPPFVSFEDSALPSSHRTPCVGSPCVFETSVSLLPALEIEVPSATLLLEKEMQTLSMINEADKDQYLLRPPSHAVDGRVDTAFCISRGVRKGDFFRLDLFRTVPSTWTALELVVLVDPTAELVLKSSVFESLHTGQWLPSDGEIRCAVITPSPLQECSIDMTSALSVKGRLQLRFVLQTEISERWCIHEIFVRGANRLSYY